MYITWSTVWAKFLPESLLLQYSERQHACGHIFPCLYIHLHSTTGCSQRIIIVSTKSDNVIDAIACDLWMTRILERLAPTFHRAGVELLWRGAADRRWVAGPWHRQESHWEDWYFSEHPLLCRCNSPPLIQDQPGMKKSHYTRFLFLTMD